MMKITYKNPSELKPYPNNPRLNEDAIDKVARSISEFGFRQPIVIDKDNMIIVGHTRWKAALRLNLDKVPVHVATDLTPEQIKAYRIADNKTSEFSDWDWPALKLELDDLKELEPETWERITGRMNGVNTVNILNSDFYIPKELPYMFKSWEEYRDYLLENLIIDEDVRKIFRNQFKLLDGRYIPEVQRMLVKTEISMLLVNDYESTKLESFTAAHGLDTIKYRKQHELNLTGKLPKDYVHNRTKD